MRDSASTIRETQLSRIVEAGITDFTKPSTFTDFQLPLLPSVLYHILFIIVK